MEKEKNIYDLKLHEGMVINPVVSVFRVPGGWVYKYTYGSMISLVFVPFNSEFTYKQ